MPDQAYLLVGQRCMGSFILGWPYLPSFEPMTLSFPMFPKIFALTAKAYSDLPINSKEISYVSPDYEFRS